MKYTHRFTGYYDEFRMGCCLICKTDFIYQDSIPNYCPECGIKFNEHFTKRNPRYKVNSTLKQYPFFLIEYTTKQVKGQDFYSDFLRGFISKKDEWFTYTKIPIELTGSAKHTIQAAKSLIDGDHYKSIKISLVKNIKEIDIIYKWDSKNPTYIVKPMQCSGWTQCSG